MVIHGSWTYHSWAAARECANAGIPYAYFPHGMLEQWAMHGQGTLKSLKKRLYWQLFERRICQGARCTFFTTLRERALSPSAVALSRETHLMRPYGMDAHVTPVLTPANPALQQPKDKNIALFLGRLHSKKTSPC